MPNQSAVMNKNRLPKVNAKNRGNCVSGGKLNQFMSGNGDMTIMAIANHDPIPRVLTVERGKSK
ncbi:hypothetical protein D3C85_1418320 [compost metagenome]